MLSTRHLASRVPGYAAAAVLIILLIAPLHVDHSGRILQAWWDFAHVPTFAFLSWRFIALSREVSRSRPRAFAAWLAAVMLVPFVEWIQGYTGRDRSLDDVAYGLAGCVIGGLLYGRRNSLRLAALFLAVVAAVYPVRIMVDEWRVERMFPVISTFSSPFELSRWSVTSCRVEEGEGWRVTLFDKAAYPALFLRNPPRDWSKASAACIQLYLEGTNNLEMWVRLDDRPGDPPFGQRFQAPFELRPGAQTVRIPRDVLARTSGGREMNLANIQAFGVFFDHRDAGKVVRLTKLYLEEGPLK